MSRFIEVETLVPIFNECTGSEKWKTWKSLFFNADEIIHIKPVDILFVDGEKEENIEGSQIVLSNKDGFMTKYSMDEWRDTLRRL